MQIFHLPHGKGITTLAELEAYASDKSEKMHKLNQSIKEKNDQIKKLNERIRLTEDRQKLKPVFDAIPPKGSFGRKREKYMEAHDGELWQFHAVARKLESAQKKAK